MVLLCGGAYTCSAIGYRFHYVAPAAAAHEAAVAEFMAKAKRRAPVKVAAVTARWVVLTESQMSHRERREIACGDGNDLMIVGSRTRLGYALPLNQSP